MVKEKKFNVLAIIGFILSLTIAFSIVGFILCIIAIVQIHKKNQRGLGLAIAGLAISLIFPIMLLGLAMLGFFTLYGNSVVGSGNVISETYDLAGFKSVTIGNGADLIVTQGDEYFVKVEAEDNILEALDIEVDDRGLKVSTEEFVWIKNTKPIKVYVTMPEVATLTVEGSGSVVSDGEIITDKLNLRIFGSGNMEIQTQISDLSSRILGSGDMVLSGTADEYSAVIEGSGDVNALDLIARDVSSRISGSGDMKLHATELLDVTIEGSGDVIYKGDAKVTQHISGSGDIVAI